MIRTVLIAICIWAYVGASSAKEMRHSASGMVVSLDANNGALVISCREIPGYMNAMEMTFLIRSPDALNRVRVGDPVQFTMVQDNTRFFADDIQVVRDANGEAEPVEAARLTMLHRVLDPEATRKQVQAGENVPDFALCDQAGRAIRLSQFQGKVVALTFAYPRCPNPNYCFRLANNLAQVARRFSGLSAEDLILLTIVIDPTNDSAAGLATYGRTWNADPVKWYFLTGSVDQVRRVALFFGMNFWDDEGFLTHTFHTVVIDRNRHLVANIEGNRFTAKQLGDLVESVLLKSTPNR